MTERSPPGLNDAWSERQGGNHGGQAREEGRQEQMNGNEQDAIWKLEVDEIMTKPHLDRRRPRRGSKEKKKISTGRNDMEHGGCGSIIRN